jgi:hypothetical protein
MNNLTKLTMDAHGGLDRWRQLKDKGEAEDLRMYQSTDYASTVERFRRFMIAEGRNGLSPDRLGQAVFTALTARHPKTSYTVIPKRLKNWSFPLFLPKRLVDKMIAKQLGLTRAHQS